VRYCSVDRIEGETAVLLFDSGKERRLASDSFKFQIEEGMVLKKKGGKYLFDGEETERRRASAAALLRKIKEKKGG